MVCGRPFFSGLGQRFRLSAVISIGPGRWHKFLGRKATPYQQVGGGVVVGGAWWWLSVDLMVVFEELQTEGFD